MHNDVTARIASEIANDEALVLEAYKDSVGVWTWGVGVTSASGHRVFPRYKDRPQSIERVMEVFVWLLEENYAPAVREAFKGHDLTEAQFGAALSFHYNTGAIKRASNDGWVKKFKAGDLSGARRSFMSWNKAGGKINKGLVDRRKRETALFFDGKWHNLAGLAPVYGVRKPSYTPDWSSRKMIDCRGPLDALINMTPEELVPPASKAQPAPIQTPRSKAPTRRSLWSYLFGGTR